MGRKGHCVWVRCTYRDVLSSLNFFSSVFFGLSLQTSVCWRTQEGAGEAGGEEGGGE